MRVRDIAPTAKLIRDDRKIVDELCVCGCLKSNHDGRDCEQFAWVSFKLEDGTFWPDPSPIVPETN
jgi:hypothetical protein